MAIDRKQRRSLLGLGLCFLVLCLLIVLFEVGVIPSTSTYAGLNLLTGIDFQRPETIHPVVFAVLVTIRIMLTVGAFLGIGFIVVESILERKAMTLKLAEAVKIRDEMLKTDFKHFAEQYMTEDAARNFEKEAGGKLDQIFSQTNEKWEELIGRLFSEDRAKELSEHMKAEI
ncbi:hypothetical protein [Chromatocurvus halotolerans]|uniref:Uncharacterized protein n=1 Tax=Chromatocurvus halotolerans TaxID=1132028 RepID=A0A4V2S9V6_9GAMM|nr:hypothetical protein [Chromatocurvus halotolerans]TCO69370.1 hypothetical protein EV688_1342 [Chromatocurvus halotolerans]